MSHTLFEGILRELEHRGFKLAIAESLTGGSLSADFVSIEGASRVFLGSVVAYQDSVKHRLLGVPKQLLEDVGAVSSEVAVAMASGVRALFARETAEALDRVVAISTTGMASPSSDEDQAKPQGLVFVAVELPGQPAEWLQLNLSGRRNEIRREAAEEAANLLNKLLLRD